MNHLNLPGLEEALEEVEFFERDRTDRVGDKSLPLS
jgi:hypothetical protein